MPRVNGGQNGAAYAHKISRRTDMANKSSKGTALVTGASSGIGAIYADRLAKRGYDLIIVARDERRLGELATRITDATGRNVEVLPADLTAKAHVARVAKRVLDDKAITLLVNNAGIAAKGHLAEMDPDKIDQIIDLNITALSQLAAAGARSFAAKGAGTIINVASVLGLVPEIFNAPYSASKAYVIALTQTMNAELKDRGVRVQAVLPGATRTEIWERAGLDVDGYPPEMVMEVGEMVDAALAGLDLGELLTIPSLPDYAEWEKVNAARLALGPSLSRNHAADRYTKSAALV